MGIERRRDATRGGRTREGKQVISARGDGREPGFPSEGKSCPITKTDVQKQTRSGIRLFGKLANSERSKDFVRATIPRSIRNWLRSPSRSAEWVMDSARFYAGATEAINLAPDLKIVCHPQAYRAVLEAQVNDPDQRAEFEHFLSLCSADMFLFDIGAHFGVFSIAAALKGAKAAAVDPSPSAVRMMAKQVALNGCEGNIRIIRAAVSDSNGAIDLLSSGVFSQGYFKVAKGRHKRELTTSAALTIDELVRRLGVPTHIKIDVEGHEAAVLRGARSLLLAHSPVLLLELHNEMVRGEGGDPKALLDEIEELGFSVFDSAGCPVVPREILLDPIVRVVAARNPR